MQLNAAARDANVRWIVVSVGASELERQVTLVTANLKRMQRVMSMTKLTANSCSSWEYSEQVVKMTRA